MSQNGDSLPPPELSPRLCVLEKWPNFTGYGFNLHAERGKAGQFIGKVDDGSPASKAELKQGDKIVEVNRVNVLNQNHHQVVTMIKESGDKVELLVVDKPAEDYYKKYNIIITSDAVNVIHCDGRKATENGATEEPAVNGTEYEGEAEEHIAVVETVVAVESAPVVESVPEPEPEAVPEPDYEPDYEPVEFTRQATPTPPPILDQAWEPAEEPVEEIFTQHENSVQHAEPQPPTPEPKPETPEPRHETPEPKPETPEPRHETPEPKPETPEPKSPTPEPVVVVVQKPQQNGETKAAAPPPPQPAPKEDLSTFKMSAKEYREMMTKKKEKDARNRAIGFKAKKDAFDQL